MAPDSREMLDEGCEAIVIHLVRFGEGNRYDWNDPLKILKHATPPVFHILFINVS
jgi:hypothetical protein